MSLLNGIGATLGSSGIAGGVSPMLANRLRLADYSLPAGFGYALNL
jgi:hypothetical protein